MCGICGIYGESNKQLITKMMVLLKHRGNNQKGIFIDNKISLGHQRLSIIDLSKKGKQPMCNEDNSVVVTFNGEIYNFKELRTELKQLGHHFNSETDTEVIVHGYEEFGIRLFEKLNGAFAIGIFDSLKKEIILARDHLGIKPLYYYKQQEKLYFASEIKALLANQNIKREINKKALQPYFAIRTNLYEETFFKNIYRVPPSTYIRFNGKSISKYKFWEVYRNKKTTKQKGSSFYEKKLSKLFDDSVKKRLMSDIPFGVFLSGGIDSSAIVATMHRLGARNFKTFSVSFGIENEKKDIKNAQFISEQFSTNHHIVNLNSTSIQSIPKIIYHHDEPLADPASIPTFALAKFAKQHGVSVVLTGEGADEIFGGYSQFKFIKKYQLIKQFPKPVKKAIYYSISHIPKIILNKKFEYTSKLGNKGLKRFKTFLYSKNENEAYKNMVSIFDEKERKALLGTSEKVLLGKSLKSIMNFETKKLLPENLLMKLDKNSMAHTVEARVPFLDKRIVELAYQIPLQFKVKMNKDKIILRKMLKDRLPKHITTSKKRRFYVPIDEWMNNDLQSIIDSKLETLTTKHPSLFNQSEINKIKEKNNLFYARQKWELFNFQLWYETFFEQDSIKELKTL